MSLTLSIDPTRHTVTASDDGDVHTDYDEDGVRVRQYVMKDGKQEGTQTIWYKDGNVAQRGTYSGGEREGRFTLWSEEGDVVHEVDYTGGTPTRLVTLRDSQGRNGVLEPDGEITVWGVGRRPSTGTTRWSVYWDVICRPPSGEPVAPKELFVRLTVPAGVARFTTCSPAFNHLNENRYGGSYVSFVGSAKVAEIVDSDGKSHDEVQLVGDGLRETPYHVGETITPTIPVCAIHFGSTMFTVYRYRDYWTPTTRPF